MKAIRRDTRPFSTFPWCACPVFQTRSTRDHSSQKLSTCYAWVPHVDFSGPSAPHLKINQSFIHSTAHSRIHSRIHSIHRYLVCLYEECRSRLWPLRHCIDRCNELIGSVVVRFKHERLRAPRIEFRAPRSSIDGLDYKNVDRSNLPNVQRSLCRIWQCSLPLQP